MKHMVKTRFAQAVTLLLLLSSYAAQAQNNPVATELTITLSEQRVKFVPTRGFQEMRLEITNSLGESVFSQLTSDAAFEWNLRASSGEALAPGLYRYTLTIKYAEGDERPHQGHFIIEKSQDQLWLTTKDDDEISGAAMTATRSAGRNIAGITREPNEKSSKREVNEREVVPLAGDNPKQTKNDKAETNGKLSIDTGASGGTTGYISRWTSATVLQDSVIFQDGTGRVGIGTTTPGDTLEVAGATNIGGSFVNGMNFVNTAGSGFRRSQFTMSVKDNTTTKGLFGFFADSSTNPTSNQQFTIHDWVANQSRLVISPTGNIGIGNTSPGAKLDVTGTINSTQYNIFGSRVLSTPGTNNLLVGKNAGPTTPPGRENTVVGEGAGAALSDGTLVCAACTEIGLDAYRGSHNMFLGLQAGAANTTGYGNTFGGTAAGRSNTFGAYNTFTGAYAGYTNAGDNNNAFYGAFAGAFNAGGTLNTFIGTYAGKSNTTADRNAFTGSYSGYHNTTGEENTFLGAYAGFNNTAGHRNTYVGESAGHFSGTGSDNTFLGMSAGNSTSSGIQNTFVGSSAGDGNNSGSNNTALGFNADFNALNHSNATAIGANALVGCSNCLVLGSVNGANAATSDTNIGIGVTAPLTKLHVADEGGNILFGNGGGCAAGSASIGFAASLTCNNYSLRGTGTDTILNRPTGGKLLFRENQSATQMTIDAGGNVGIGTTNPADKLDVSGDIRVGTGTTGCVKDADGTVLTGTCSSDLRFKHSVSSLAPMLGKVSQLRPVNFFWRASEFPAKHFGERESFGLIAQEVEAVLPELVTTDEQGFKAVNYSKLPLLTIQAVKELKAENDTLKERLKTLEEQMRQLLEVKAKEQR